MMPQSLPTTTPPTPYDAPDPDWVLIHAMGGGDIRALNELYTRYGPMLLAFLNARVDNLTLAEELVQDVMLAAWEHAATFEARSKVKTWLLVIARNRAINTYRKRRLPVIDISDVFHLRSEDTGPTESMEKHEQAEQVRQAIRQLPEAQREVLTLVFYHQLTGPEVAEVLGISEGTVTLSGPCNSLPQPTPTIYYESTEATYCTVTNTSQGELPLYSSADAQAQIVNYFPMGSSEFVIAQSNTGWYEMYYNNQVGWFRPEGLTFQGNCSFVPLATPTSTPTQTWTPGPTSVPLQTVFSPPLKAIPVSQTVFYTVPDTGSAILQAVDGGTEWNTVGIAVINGTEWVSVFTWEGKQGWIQRSMVNIVDPTIPTAMAGS